MEKEILKLTNDLVFKRFFTYNNDYSLLGEFLSLVTGHVYDEIQVINPEINDTDIAGKQIIMDIRVKSDSALVNIEMQSYSQSDYIDRSLLYSTRHFANNNIKCGDGYIKTSPAYTINVLKNKLFDCSEYKSVFELREQNRNELLSEKFKIFFLELSKLDDKLFRNLSDPANNTDKLLFWLMLFKCEKKGDLDMFYTTNYHTMTTAADRLLLISEDEKTRVNAELREQAQADYASAMANQYAEGMTAGYNKGISMGISMGEKRGVVKLIAGLCGTKQAFLDMLKNTDCSVEDCQLLFSECPELKPSYWEN